MKGPQFKGALFCIEFITLNLVHPAALAPINGSFMSALRVLVFPSLSISKILYFH